MAVSHNRRHAGIAASNPSPQMHGICGPNPCLRMISKLLATDEMYARPAAQITAPVRMSIRAQQMTAVKGLPCSCALLALGHRYHRALHIAIPLNHRVVE